MRITLTTGRSLLLTAALGLGAAPAQAQGTPEQREACTPDAIRLCSDTIPDVGRTTTCMASHRGELSPRCRAAFDAGKPAARPRTHVARAPAAPKAEAQRRPARTAKAAAPAGHRHVRVARGRDTREARRVIGRLCATNVLDGGTCGFIGQVLTLAN